MRHVTVWAVYCGAFLAGLPALHAQSSQPEAKPFGRIEGQLAEQDREWATDNARLARLFAADRKALGARFQTELLKWLGRDIDKHYWVACYLVEPGYLNGLPQMPELALLILEQGLTLPETESCNRVSVHMVAAVVAAKLGLVELAMAHKGQAESLVREDRTLAGCRPAMSDDDRRIYSNLAETTRATKPEKP
jgi:hypothetical protein